MPVPKIPNVSRLNDYHSVALNSSIMKCFQLIVKAHITSSLPATLDPFQFLYTPNRSTDNARVLDLHCALPNLDCLLTTALLSTL